MSTLLIIGIDEVHRLEASYNALRAAAPFSVIIATPIPGDIAVEGCRPAYVQHRLSAGTGRFVTASSLHPTSRLHVPDVSGRIPFGHDTIALSLNPPSHHAPRRQIDANGTHSKECRKPIRHYSPISSMP